VRPTRVERGILGRAGWVTAALVVTATTAAWQLSDGPQPVPGRATSAMDVAGHRAAHRRLTLSGTAIDWAAPDLEVAIPARPAALAPRTIEPAGDREAGGAGGPATNGANSTVSATSAPPTTTLAPAGGLPALATPTLDPTPSTLPLSPPAGVGAVAAGNGGALTGIGGGAGSTATTSPSGSGPSGGARSVDDVGLAPAAVPSGSSSATGGAVVPEVAEARLLELLNTARADSGVGPLAIDAQLRQAAQQAAQRMAASGQLEHQDLAVFTPPFRAAAENVAMAASPDEGHAMMMGSAGHVSNLANAAYRAVGIGVAVLADGSVAICQLYAG
jgi:uncharacterized protein YkwD